jgi:PAS domain S-box-containing protein
LQFFGNLRIKYKLFLSYSVVFVAAVAFWTFAIYSNIQRGMKENAETGLTHITETLVDMVKTSATLSIRNHLRAVAERNREIASYYFREYEKGAVSEEEAKTTVRKIMHGQSIGKTGYIFVWDIRNAPALIPLVVHPVLEGKDVAEVGFVQKGAKLKNGYMEYKWSNPGEKTPRDKSMYLTYFQPWEWVIAASSYREEFNELVDVEDFRGSISSIKFGESGYAFMMDTKGNILVHPELTGDASSVADTDGRLFIGEISAQKRGKITYSWQRLGQPSPVKEMVVFDYIPDYDWIVACATGLDHVYGPLQTVKRLLMGVVLTAVFLILFISFWISSHITNPLRELMLKFASGAAGDFSARMATSSRDEVGRLAGYFNTFMERLQAQVSERKLAEEALQESEKTYRRLLELSPEAIFVHRDGKIIVANSAAAGLFGYSNPNQILGKSVLEFVHPDFRRIINERIRLVAAEGRTVPFMEQKYLKPDGTVIQVEATGIPFTYKGEISVQTIARDITERKQAEVALKKAEENYRNIFENAIEGIFQATPGGTYLSANPALARIYGYGSPEELINNVQDIARQLYVNAQRRQELTRLMWEQGMVSGFEFQIYRKDGTMRWVSMNARAVRDGDGHILYYEGTVEDITDREELEGQLRQAQKMEAIGTLAGGIAHDFNNILSAIFGYAEMALFLCPKDNPLRPNLEGVLKAGLRARDLVRQILAISRRGEQERRPVSVAPIVKEAVKLLRASLPSTIEISQNIESAGKVIADPIQIHQIIMNLCTNAHHAMRRTGGTLEVGLVEVELNGETSPHLPALPAGPYLKLSVRDTGHGMDAMTSRRIFDPYFTTKTHGEGSGLGLAVVHGIVKSHGGDITVQSVPGKGTLFNVLLPRTQAAGPDEPPRSKAIPRGTERILLVDDEKPLVEIATAMLRRLGYEITPVNGSMEALEIFRARSDDFHMVITDQTMPHMTGDTLAQEILRIHPDMPIILCTGFSELVTEERAKEIGIRELVLKPFVMHELAATVRKVLDS